MKFNLKNIKESSQGNMLFSQVHQDIVLYFLKLYNFGFYVWVCDHPVWYEAGVKGFSLQFIHLF